MQALRQLIQTAELAEALGTQLGSQNKACGELRSHCRYSKMPKHPGLQRGQGGRCLPCPESAWLDVLQVHMHVTRSWKGRSR